MSPFFFHIYSDDLIKVIWPNLIREKQRSVREGGYPGIPFHSLVCTEKGKEAKSNTNPESSKPHTQPESLKRHGNSLCPYDCETPRHIFQGIILRVMILPLKPNNPEPPWDWPGHELACEMLSCELVLHGTGKQMSASPMQRGSSRKVLTLQF